MRQKTLKWHKKGQGIMRHPPNAGKKIPSIVGRCMITMLILYCTEKGVRRHWNTLLVILCCIFCFRLGVFLIRK